MNDLIYLKNVVTLDLDGKKCIGCEMCVIVCPHEVFSVNDKCAKIENKDACMECGACAMNCPAGAITVKIGVGCAAAVINKALGKKNSACCCVDESEDNKSPKKNCC